MKHILNLAYQRLKRNRKNSIFIFLVLLLSFSCAIVSVSVIGSIAESNAEYLLDTYGEWYLALPYGYESDAKWISQRVWADATGISESVGTVEAANKSAGIGTIDETLIDIGRITLNEGEFPDSDSEIAMEADLLSALGYDYTLGQEVTVNVMIPFEDDSYFPLTVEKTYTLCGIIREYSDLWYLSRNQNNIPLNSAVITDNAAAELIEDAEKKLEAEKMFLEGLESTVRRPIPQYFVSVAEENRELAEKEFNKHLEARLHGHKEGDIQVCVNSVAYSGSAAETNDFYVCMIAVLTFISVICLEIIRLPANTHSFSVLRSIGMSKKQLAMLQLSEILILGIPAILLGIPLGAGLTWAALKLTLFSGSVPIQVYIPYETLFFIIALWIAAIILSRLIIFLFTLRVPMTGGLQMSTSKSKYTRKIRSGFIALLLCIFSESVVFTGMQSIGSELYMEKLSMEPSYGLHSRRTDDPLLHSDDINIVKEIPGVSKVYGISELYIGLSFDGQSEEATNSAVIESLHGADFPYGMVYLLVVDENDWLDVLKFEENGNDKEAFCSGEYVFVSFPYNNEKEYPMPDGKANISIYNYENTLPTGLEDNTSENDKRKFIGSCTVNTRNIIFPEYTRTGNTAGINNPYTVICSEQFFRGLLESLPKGYQWGRFVTGGKFGYANVFAMTDLNSGGFSTDIILAKICKERKIGLFNDRELYHARIQACLQTLIMLYFSGACVGIIALLILLSNISLETEGEKRSFLIKRCIGMSKRQINRNIIGKTLIRCISALLLSCIVYFSWDICIVMHMPNKPSFLQVVDAIIIDLIHYFQQNGIGKYVIMLFLGLILPVILILHAKKDLRKDGDIK